MLNIASYLIINTQMIVINITHCLSDTSCGSFEGPGVQPCLRLHLFASEQRDLPPLEKKGDFIYLFNVEIAEWQGNFKKSRRGG